MCAGHHSELMHKDVGRTHGVVTEPIPRAKLLEFVRKAKRDDERNFGAEVGAEIEKQGR